MGFFDKLKSAFTKTATSLAHEIQRIVTRSPKLTAQSVEELEAALLMSDAGVKATEWLLHDLKRRVKEAKATEPLQVKALLVEALSDMLAPLQRPLVVGEHSPTVMMVVGVNGAGKTTTIGKLTRHLAEAGQQVLLAAGDTFRAAAREQLAAWAQRNDQAAASTNARVDIVSQEGADPAAVAFDAVSAGRARGKQVVMVDTAGRLPTQLHLMEELKKVQRVVGKAMEGAPHEVLLVVDGHTGQNALAQAKAFDAALGLTGLVVTKLDGTAKGGVLAAMALWGHERRGPQGQTGPVPVYFIGVGETLEDLETFQAREFAQALIG